MRATAVLFTLTIFASGCLNPETRDADLPDSALTVDRYLGPALADPLKDGPLSYTIKEYDQGIVKVGGRDSQHKNYSYDARLRGVLFTPQGAGPFPVLVFLHGQHATCGMAGRESFIQAPPPAGSGNCEGPQPWHPYQNHRGYDYLGKHLASHGYVVASVLGKEVNERNGNPDIGMWARGELILATLDKLKAAHLGEIDLGLQGKLDLGRIGLMGHSRGGEGVVTATLVNAERAQPYDIRAVIPLAPTDFARRGVNGSAILSLVPYCDGDVSSLHGLRTYDHSRYFDDHVKVQILVFGANHNNYNTQWGKGEVGGVYRDGDDAQVGRHLNAECDLNRNAMGGRLTLDDTLREGLLHMAGFFRWILGGEDALGPYFTGEAAMPGVACPSQAAQCPDAARVSALMPGRRWAFNVTADGIKTHAATAVQLDGFDAPRTCALARCAPNMYSAATSIELTWTKRATLTAHVPPGFFAGMDVLAFRAAVPSQGDHNKPNEVVDLSVSLLGAGQRSTVAVSQHSRALTHPPGETFDRQGAAPVGFAKVSLNMVRIPLNAFGPEAANATTIELSFDKTASGRLLLSELYAQPERQILAWPAAAVQT